MPGNQHTESVVAVLHDIPSRTVGAVPILNRLLERMQLERLRTRHLPPDDKRTKINTPRIVLLLLKNLLVSREPM